MSDSEIAPAAALIILIFTWSLFNFSKLALTASALPVESVFKIILIWASWPSLILSNNSSREEILVLRALSYSIFLFFLLEAISLACFSVGKAINESPAKGTSLNPIIETGIEGVADFNTLLCSLVILLTFP